MEQQAVIPVWVVSIIVGGVVSGVLALLGFFATLAHRQLMQRLDHMDAEISSHRIETTEALKLVNDDLSNQGQRIAHLEGSEGHSASGIPHK